jgi:hypothetical protein
LFENFILENEIFKWLRGMEKIMETLDYIEIKLLVLAALKEH